MNRQHLKAELTDKLAEIAALFAELHALNGKTYEMLGDPSDVGRLLNQQRKALGIDLETLHLQTDISLSTLKRLFKDPSQVRFSTLLLVAQTLGVRLCIEK